MNFNSFNLSPAIVANIKALGYETPTPIQTESIPAIIQGKDVMGLAKTGSGKTAAFALPIINSLLKGPRKIVRAVIIAPTRELAQQIHEAIEDFAKGTGLKSLTLYGGVNINPQIKSLAHGVEIIVACPGRLMDHIQQRTINVSKTEVLVLDEADQMFDMGFLPDIRKILRFLPKERQTLLFSATMPEAIHNLANDVLHHPIKVDVGHSTPPTTVKQALFPVPKHLKTALLMHILHKTAKESVLVFTRTKHTAKKVAQKLADAGFSATSLQGNLSQNKRQIAMRGFRDGSLQILVATDIASRGIDVSSVSHVINYDIPSTVEAYIHRIGRTGRAAKEGEAFTLITDEDKAEVRAIEKVLGKAIPAQHIEDFDYSVAAPARTLGEHASFKRPQQKRRSSHHQRERSRDR